MSLIDARNICFAHLIGLQQARISQLLLLIQMIEILISVQRRVDLIIACFFAIKTGKVVKLILVLLAHAPQVVVGGVQGSCIIGRDPLHLLAIAIIRAIVLQHEDASADVGGHLIDRSYEHGCRHHLWLVILELRYLDIRNNRVPLAPLFLQGLTTLNLISYHLEIVHIV